MEIESIFTHPVLHMVRMVMVVRSVMVVRVGRLLTMGVVRRGRTVGRERVARQLTWES